MTIPAILKDKKGFTKFIQVPYPPPSVYNIPVESTSYDWKDNKQISYYKINYLEFGIKKFEDGVVYYEELT